MFKQKISLAITFSTLFLFTPNITLANVQINQEEKLSQQLESHLPTKPVAPPNIFIAQTIPSISVYNNYIDKGNQAIQRGLRTGNIYHYHTALINYDKALEVRPEEILVKRAINDLELYLYDYYMRQGYSAVKEAQKTRNYYYYVLALDNFTRATFRKAEDVYAKDAIANVKKYIEPDYLNQELKQAVCAENWQKALNVIQTIKDIQGKNYNRQLDQYRARYLYILTHNSATPTYPPQEYCNAPVAQTETEAEEN